MCVVLGAERRLKQRREIGLENEAEAKACVQTSGEAGKTLTEPQSRLQRLEGQPQAQRYRFHSPEVGGKP